MYITTILLATFRICNPCLIMRAILRLNDPACVFCPGGGPPLEKLYRYVPSHPVGFLRRFGLKTGIHFAHFCLESDMVFRELRECMNVFNVSIPNE